MRTKFRKDTKKCPRCKNKCLNSQKKCDACGLVFARLDEATNTQAKKQFFAKEKSVVKVTRAKDVNKLKLLALCTFLGIYGAHNFYVGRYYRAAYMLVWGLFSTVYAGYLTNFPEVVSLVSTLPFVLCIGILGIFWISDFTLILIERFKIPVALEKK